MLITEKTKQWSPSLFSSRNVFKVPSSSAWGGLCRSAQDRCWSSSVGLKSAHLNLRAAFVCVRSFTESLTALQGSPEPEHNALVNFLASTGNYCNEVLP